LCHPHGTRFNLIPSRPDQDPKKHGFGGQMLQPSSVWQPQEPGSSHVLPPALTSSSSRPTPRRGAQRGGLCPAHCSRRSPNRLGALHKKLGINVKLINWERRMHCHKKPSVSPRRPSSHLRSPRSRALAAACESHAWRRRRTAGHSRWQIFFASHKAPHEGNREKHKARMEKLGKPLRQPPILPRHTCCGIVSRDTAGEGRASSVGARLTLPA